MVTFEVNPDMLSTRTRIKLTCFPNKLFKITSTKSKTSRKKIYSEMKTS